MARGWLLRPLAVRTASPPWTRIDVAQLAAQGVLPLQVISRMYITIRTRVRGGRVLAVKEQRAVVRALSRVIRA